jgi:hypothetical protein
MLMKLVSIVSDILNEQIASAVAASQALNPNMKVGNLSQGGEFKMGQGPIRYSNQAVNLIKKFESFQDKAYLCSAGKKTIGYGTR